MDEMEARGMEEVAFFTVGEVAKKLRVWPETVRMWLQEGSLVGVKLPGGQWRIRPEDVDSMLSRTVR